MGFYHEHQRPDRDQFIQIDFSVIPQGLENQFYKILPEYLNTSVTTPYDVSSIMHYDSFGNTYFQRPVLRTINGTLIEQNKNMSELDIQSLNNMYPCNNSCDNTDNQGMLNTGVFKI